MAPSLAAWACASWCNRKVSLHVSMMSLCVSGMIDRFLPPCIVYEKKVSSFQETDSAYDTHNLCCSEDKYLPNAADCGRDSKITFFEFYDPLRGDFAHQGWVLCFLCRRRCVNTVHAFISTRQHHGCGTFSGCRVLGRLSLAHFPLSVLSLSSNFWWSSRGMISPQLSSNLPSLMIAN